MSLQAPAFDSFIGIDYSGAQTAHSRINGLQVFSAHGGEEPQPVRPVAPGRNWSRAGLAHWLLAEILHGQSLLIGMDHNFSFPLSYFKRYGLESWPAFLDDFCRYWPADQENCSVDSIRDGTWWEHHLRPPGERTGSSREFRICEQWTSSAKSVFQFDMQGAVAKSSHAGIPWLRFLRAELGEKLFFWPFDGWQPPAGVSVIAEAYPSVFRNRFDRDGRNVDEQDAYSVARWLEESARRGILARYFDPPLTLPERRVAALEGWILGIA